jgi:AcrR family transcriptional regulator
MDVEIPASIAAAWGLRERPTKGPKRALTLDGIVAAGIKVAGTEGLPAVSMARVATEIGASTMSLYRYVASKDELLSLMVDAAYGVPPGIDPRAQGWREGLNFFARAEREALARHPWIVLVPLSGPPVAPHQTSWLEWGLATMHATGLTPHEKLEVMLLVTMFTRNESAVAAQMTAAQQAAGESNEQAMSTYRAILKQLLDPQRYPEMTAVLDSGIFDKPDDPDFEFEFGLARILDGIEALVRQR